jgi:uncharacterized protein YndB with AHSA1/START domain/uncharacterized damage-inducible protein DinB
MPAKKRVLKMERTVQGDRERVFAALTDAIRLQEWFCDRAWTDPQTGGRYALRWRSGHEVHGTFVELDPPEEVVMVWQASGEPGQTLVEWELKESHGGTQIELKHSGFGSGPRWDAAYAEAEKGWTTALENLQATLEDGQDLRVLRRPFLGVGVDGMDAQRAEKEGIAVDTGVYITAVTRESAAEAAGVQKGDVIVAVGEHEVTDLDSMTSALQTLRAGDAVPLGLVRKQDRLTVQATLKQRDAVEVPKDPAEAAARLREQHAQTNGALSEATAGLSAAAAERPAAEGEWSVKAVLAHLSITERDTQQFLALVAVGLGFQGQGNPSNWPDRIAGTLAAEPTLAGLLARFARDQEETALHVEHLSETTRADRSRYRRIVEAVVLSAFHTENHVAQIRETVAAVREAS